MNYLVDAAGFYLEQGQSLPVRSSVRAEITPAGSGCQRTQTRELEHLPGARHRTAPNSNDLFACSTLGVSGGVSQRAVRFQRRQTDHEVSVVRACGAL
jgi:hypothetical protein